MKKKIKKYFVNPDDSCLLAMSVVDEPAVESNFIYLSKQQKIDKFVALQSNEKRMIYGCALRPDFPIYRRDDEEEYYLEFSKEAVEKLSRDFMVNGLQSNFTAAHKKAVDGITITESWIKVDMEKDKSIALGLDADLPVGSWIIGGYCDNNDIWNKVKDGEYHGFSVEAIVDVDELKFEEQVPDENVAPATDSVQSEPTVEVKESILDKILNLISGKPIEEVAKPTAKEVEKETEIAPEPPKAEEPTVVPQDEKEAVTEEKKPKEPEVNPLEEVVNNLKAEIEALKKANNGLKDEINDLSKEPSAKPVNTNKGSGGKGDTYQQWRNVMREMIS